MKTKIISFILVLIAVVLLFCNSNRRTVVDNPQVLATTTSTAFASTLEGKYQFDEMSADLNGLQNVWSYKLNMYKEEGKLKAHLTVDGYQTMIDINTTTNIIDGHLEIVFDSYGKENMFTPYKKGDVLFTLTPAEITEDPTDLGINWNKMQPQLVENKMRSAFVKVID